MNLSLFIIYNATVMKNLLKYLHTFLIICASAYLWYYVVTTMPGDQNAMFIAAGVSVFLLFVLWIKYSHVGMKKRWIIGLGIAGIIASEYVFVSPAFADAHDLVKIGLVVTIFVALFGVFGEKKAFVKGEYSKKTEIIEV